MFIVAFVVQYGIGVVLFFFHYTIILGLYSY